MVGEMIQKTLDYVDGNIKEDITAEELADITGSVMQYVLRRKLLHVIYEIGLGRKKNDSIIGL